MKIFDPTRNARQELGILRWRDAGGKGTLHWTMAVGKTAAGLEIMKRMANQRPIRVIITCTLAMVVDKWKKELEDLVKEKTTTYPITFICKSVQAIVVKNKTLRCDLLIVDEVQEITGEIYRGIIDGTFIEYQYGLGLTGTFYDNKSRYLTIAEYLPIVDTITEQDARSAGWISSSKEYVYSIQMMEHEQLEYKRISEKIFDLMQIFNNDYKLVSECTFGRKSPTGNLDNYQVACEVSIKHGWHYSYPRIIRDSVDDNKRTEQEIDRIIQIDSQWNPKHIINWAFGLQNLIKNRIDLLSSIKNKEKAILDILNTISGYTIIFTSRTSAADRIYELLSENLGKGKVGIYHTKITSKPLIDPATGDYFKYQSGAKKGLIKKFGKVVLKKKLLEDINSGRIRVVVVTNAFDAGVDITKLKLAIIHSGNSSSIKHAQRTGRAKRLDLEELQDATIVNLITYDTQEESWLRNRQVNNSVIVHTANEIVEYNSGKKEFEKKPFIKF